MENSRAYNAVEEMVDRNVALGRGEKVAFADPDRSLTYGALQFASNRVANLLMDLGSRQERRIALLLHDTVDFPVVFWGALRGGVVPVCLNTLLTVDQYRYVLDDCRAEVLFVSAPLLPVVAPLFSRLGHLRHVVVCGAEAGAADYPALASLLNGADAHFPTARTLADETAFWLYSSGSTGAPKAVRHVHASPGFVAAHYGKHILGIRSDDVCFAAAKLFFAYGMGAAMAIPMSVGATVVLNPGRVTPARVLDIMRRHEPTLFFGVPTLYASLLADGDWSADAMSRRLRLCISAGEALPEALGKAWKKHVGVDIVDGVGNTEMLHAFVSTRPGDIRYGTAGRAVPGYELRLLDEADREVDDGELGELWVSGGSAGAGYWNQRERSRATFVGRWLRTGDKYFRDEEGYYHYCGRADDMFKVSGRWVSPFEVEQALTAHPAVREAAVVGCADSNGLVKPRAFVVLDEQAACDRLLKDLRDHVKQAVGVWKYPRLIDVVETLPKTATGKIKRFELRRRS